jgi:hypothetical protein
VMTTAAIMMVMMMIDEYEYDDEYEYEDDE